MSACTSTGRAFECPFCGGSFEVAPDADAPRIVHDSTPCLAVDAFSAVQFLDRVTRTTRCAHGHVYGVARPEDRADPCPFCAQGPAATIAYGLYQSFAQQVARRRRKSPRA